MVSEITASAMVVIYEPVWNNDCKLPFSGLCEEAAALDTGAGGDRERGKTAIWLFGASSKSLSLPWGPSCHQMPQAKHPRVYSIKTTFYCRGHCWIHVCSGTLSLLATSLRLGLNDQVWNVLGQRREARKRWILGPTRETRIDSAHLERRGGKEMDTLRSILDRQSCSPHHQIFWETQQCCIWTSIW